MMFPSHFQISNFSASLCKHQAVASGRCWCHAARACRFHGQSHQTNVGSTGEVPDDVWDTWDVLEEENWEMLLIMNGCYRIYYIHIFQWYERLLTNISTINHTQHIHHKPYLTNHKLIYLEGCHSFIRLLTVVRWQHGVQDGCPPLGAGRGRCALGTLLRTHPAPHRHVSSLMPRRNGELRGEEPGGTCERLGLGYPLVIEQFAMV